jgi:hypothetical protein
VPHQHLASAERVSVRAVRRRFADHNGHFGSSGGRRSCVESSAKGRRDPRGDDVGGNRGWIDFSGGYGRIGLVAVQKARLRLRRWWDLLTLLLIVLVVAAWCVWAGTRVIKGGRWRRGRHSNRASPPMSWSRGVPLQKVGTASPSGTERMELRNKLSSSEGLDPTKLLTSASSATVHTQPTSTTDSAVSYGRASHWS